MTDGDAAARAERRPVDVLLLSNGLRHPIGFDPRRDPPIADRHPSDRVTGPDVALHQGRRDREALGDVVEAVALVVGRQQRVDVELETEQVADRIGVLGAIETMQRRFPRVRRRESGLVERPFDRREESVDPGGIGTPRVGRRHHPRANLANHFFPGGGVRRHPGFVQVRQRQVAALHPVVVTADAVLADQRAVSRRRGRRSGGLAGPLRQRLGREHGRPGREQRRKDEDLDSHHHPVERRQNPKRICS